MDRDDNLLPNESDFEMLSLLIDEALSGVDVVTRYPTVFRKLLASSELREAYESALAILRADADDTLDPLPHPPSHDLSFLQTAVFLPMLSHPQPNRLQLHWCQTAQAIQALFAPPPQVAYRLGADYLADPHKTLLRGNWQHDDRDWSVVLHVTQPAAHPGSLALTLWLSSLDEPSSDTPAARPTCEARLHWGVYDQTAILDSNGQAEFPLIPFTAILGSDGETVTSDLELTLMVDS